MANIAEATTATMMAYSIRFCPFLFMVSRIVLAHYVLQVILALLPQPGKRIQPLGSIAVHRMVHGLPARKLAPEIKSHLFKMGQKAI